MPDTSGRSTCEALIGPIWKLDGETCGCNKPADHDLREGHYCPCGSWWADPSMVKPVTGRSRTES